MGVSPTDVILFEDVRDVLSEQLLVLQQDVLVDGARVVRNLLNIPLDPSLKIFRWMLVFDRIEQQGHRVHFELMWILYSRGLFHA